MKKNKIARKITSAIAMLMCVLLSFGTVACNSGSGNSKITKLTIVVGNNAFGTDILEEQAARFEQLYAEKSYAEGKTGVDVKVETSGTALNIDESLLSEGYHLISTGDGYTKAATAASNGWIASLDDIMKTEIPDEGKAIYEKIPESIRYNYYLNSKDGSSVKSGYYGIPSSEAYGGLTYDKDLFDKGYYFASADEVDFDSYECTLLGEGKTFKFTDKDGSKSVGPDGLPNTEDDGLPSSLVELIALCDYLDYNSIKPFIMSGKMGFYINYFTEALYMSLLGYENAKAQKDFASESMDIVVGYTEEDLFPGLDSVKKPIIETVKIDEAHGYYTSISVEKYYTFAFMQLMEQQGWYASASNQPNKGAVDAQLDFLFGIHEPARQGAMLIECSYWVNESRIRNNFKDYSVMYGKTHPNREYRWMSLPVNLYTAVDGEDATINTDIGTTESTKGEPITLYVATGGYLCVNARYKDNAEIMGAIKDWLLFRYSDEELSKATVKGCYGEMLNYDIKAQHLTDATNYAKSYAKLLENANKVYPYGDSDVYRNNSAKLGKQGGSASYLFGGGSLGTINVREYLKNKSVRECFEEKMFDLQDWQGYFGSNGQVAEAWTYPEGHLKEGQPIKYEGLNYTNN